MEEKLRKILYGSKIYEFEYGENGMTVLSISDYYTMENIKLDLEVLLEHPEVLEEMIVEGKEDE